jgi:hypothetical protein
LIDPVISCFAKRTDPKNFQVMPLDGKTGLYSEESFQDGKIAGWKFLYESALLADQRVPMREFAGHVAMFAGLIVHPVQSADFL